MKNVEHLKDKRLFQALKEVDNPWELIAFIFAYRSKELMMLTILILVVLNMYPGILEYIKEFFK